MTPVSDRTGQLGKLASLIHGIRVAMLTTITDDGDLRSRPMLTCRAGADGLWFFTRADAAKVDEAMHQPHVNVCYADPNESRFVSVSGAATLVRDREKMRQFWDDCEREWFPKGLDDPELALLWVSVDRAEYWDASAGAMLPVENVKIDPAP